MNDYNFSVHELIGVADLQILKKILLKFNFVESNFFHPIPLLVWLTHDNKKLFIITNNGKEFLLLHKTGQISDIRFLFKEPDDETLEKAKIFFNAKYVAANLVPSNVSSSHHVVSFDELLIDLVKIQQNNISKFFRKYNLNRKLHPDLVYKRYASDLNDDIIKFLYKWKTTRSEELNQYARIENDLLLISNYSDYLDGVVLCNDGEVVAVSLLLPSLKSDYAIGIISKCLRGYTQLGLRVFIERAKLMSELKYTYAYIGLLNNDFKFKFIESGEVVSTSSILYTSPSSFKNNERYLRQFFS